MSRLKLNFACWDYDRTRALMDGCVTPDGIDLNYLNLPVEETFVRHSCIYVNARAGIREAKNLIGKRVGSPEYQMTAPVWIRGILSDHYGVPVDSVSYFTGGEEEPGRAKKIKLDLPPNISVQPIGVGQTLSKMLLDDEIDALYTVPAPSSFYTGGGQVKRLFEDYEPVERNYFRETGIFPIMHTVALRRDVYEANRWVAQSMIKALIQAQRRSYQELGETAAVKTMLPWLTAQVEQVRRDMGDDFWPYGFEKNEATLQTFLRYSFEQGLSKRLLAPSELFAPKTLESFKI